MKTQHKITLMLFGVLLLSSMLFLSCVDIPNEEPAISDPVGAYRFIHAATDLGDVGVTIDGAAKGNMSFKSVLSHQVYPAGTRTVVLSNGDTLLVSVATQMRGTFCILDLEQGARAFLRLAERRFFDSADLGANGALRVVHLCPDGPTVSFEAMAADTVAADFGDLAYKKISPYMGMPPGDYSLKGNAGAIPLINYPISVGTTRMTVFVIGKAAALDVLVVNDN
ncbi:DUF4397 domain-containing protein [candidate division KSB1 bacterium]|nr:DUF4397 domain-containing protein [candidate division KSB1 bacterium]